MYLCQVQFTPQLDASFGDLAPHVKLASLRTLL